jgi:hypothetical protein
MEWPGIKIPQAIINILDAKGLSINFINDNGEWEEHLFRLYERNPAGRGLEIDNSPNDKPDIDRYAVKFRCQNLVSDTRKSPLSPLEDLAKATTILLVKGPQPDKEPQNELVKLFHTTSSLTEWFLAAQGPCNRDLRLNLHLLAGGVGTPDRIQDPEGSNAIVISFKKASRAFTAIERQTFRFVCFSGKESGKLVIDSVAKAGGKQNLALHGRHALLIYKAQMHP